MTPKRLEQKQRLSQLLDAALTLAERHGYSNITHDAVAAAAQCTRGLVVHYLGTAPNMRRDIMRAAIAKGCVRVVAQGLAAGDRHAAKAPDTLKRQAAKSLTSAG